MVKIKCPHFFYKLLMRPFVILLQELRIWQSSEFAACMQTKEGLSQTLLWSSCHLHPFSSTQSPSAVLSDGAISTKSSQKVLFRSLSCAAVTEEWTPSYSPSLSPSHTKTHMHLPLSASHFAHLWDHCRMAVFSLYWEPPCRVCRSEPLSALRSVLLPMACKHHVIGLQLEAGSELVYVTSVLCDNATVLSVALPGSLQTSIHAFQEAVHTEHNISAVQKRGATLSNRCIATYGTFVLSGNFESTAG